MSALKESVNWDFMFDPPSHSECGCQLCHERHRTNNEPDLTCLKCLDEICPECNGEVWIQTTEGEEECQKCNGGWTLEILRKIYPGTISE